VKDDGEAAFLFDEAPFPECHASTLAEVDGALVAAWFAGSREGRSDVGIWLSRREAGRWSAPRLVAEGRDARGRPLACWNPVLHVRAGVLYLFYKVGPSPRRWWGMWMRSHDGGRSFGSATPLPRGILGPVKNKPLELDDGRLLCGSSSEHWGWRVHLEWAREVEGRWSRTRALNGGFRLRAIQPGLLRHGSRRLQLLCRTRNGRMAEAWSEDAGERWSALRLTPLPDASSGLDAVTLRDGRHLLVYNHARAGRSPLNLALSEDGRRWWAARVLESGPGEYSYPAAIEASDGSVHLTYTWKRRRIRHVALDPGRLSLREIRDGRWPD